MPSSWVYASAAAARVGATSDGADQALHNTAAFAGFAAYALMAGTVVWGMFTATGLVRSRIRRETLYNGHMTMAVAALAFVLVHVAANVLRPAAHLSVWSASVPFFGTSAAITAGVLGAEFAVVTSVSVWFQRRLGYRTWQRLHLLGYPAYVLAIAHTLVAGSDVRRPLIATFLAVTVAIVAVLALMRLLPSTSTLRSPLLPMHQSMMSPPSDALRGFLEPAEELPDRGLRIRVDVNRNHCQQYAICEQEAPEVFRMRGDGRLEYQGSPDPDHRDAVRQAARLCPMQAIFVEERRR